MPYSRTLADGGLIVSALPCTNSIGGAARVKYCPGIGGHSAPESTAAAFTLLSVQQVLATRAATVSPPSDWPAAAISWLFSTPDTRLSGWALSVSRLLSTKDMSAGWFTRSCSVAAVPSWQLVFGKVTAATR